MTSRLVSREKRQVLLLEVSLWWAKLWPKHTSEGPQANTYRKLYNAIYVYLP